MTKRQILQRLFLRFLMNNTFYKKEFVEIWALFIGHKNNFNNLENFEAIHSFFYTRLALLHKDLKVKRLLISTQI
jgi:hypothetical protein